jgi:hypothetical protein
MFAQSFKAGRPVTVRRRFQSQQWRLQEIFPKSFSPIRTETQLLASLLHERRRGAEMSFDRQVINCSLIYELSLDSIQMTFHCCGPNQAGARPRNLVWNRNIPIVDVLPIQQRSLPAASWMFNSALIYRSGVPNASLLGASGPNTGTEASLDVRAINDGVKLVPHGQRSVK